MFTNIFSKKKHLEHIQINKNKLHVVLFNTNKKFSFFFSLYQNKICNKQRDAHWCPPEKKHHSEKLNKYINPTKSQFPK